MKMCYSMSIPVLTTLAGLPATIEFAGTDLVTTEPAATNAPSPIVTPANIIEQLPTYAPSLISILPK